MSATSPRLRRMRLDRIGPDRNTRGSPRQPQPSGTPQNVVSAAGAAVCGMVEGGVRTAYSVIDEYLRRGQEAARGLFNDSNMRGPMNQVRGNCSGYAYAPWSGYGQPGGYCPPGSPMTMMMDQWLTAMRTWTGFWFACIPPPMQQYPPCSCGQPSNSCGMHGSQSLSDAANPDLLRELLSRMQNEMRQATKVTPTTSTDCRLESVRVTVSSTGGLVDCTANLSPGVYPQGVICDPLHDSGSACDIVPELVVSGAILRVTVKVPPGHPSGTYCGKIRRKPDQCVVGDVTLCIAPAAS
jgi:hypothetical protein